ncbi:hypothetical protein SRHO_G00343840 [Serrasalmus rhombeus]
MRLYLKCVEDIRREIATLPLQITDFYMFLFIEFLGTKTVALVPKSWGKHDVRILKSCNKLFQRFQLEVIQLQYPGSPLLQGCTNLSGRGRGQEQRVFPALEWPYLCSQERTREGDRIADRHSVRGTPDTELAAFLSSLLSLPK